MGTNTLTEVAPGDVVKASDKNEINTALTGDFVPRNVTARDPEGSAHKCGIPTVTWLEGHFDNIFIGGTLFSPTSVGVTNYRIDAGESRSTSDQPIFVKPAGVAATVDVDGAITPLQLTINNETATITTTVTSSALDVAPSTNNTALVNDILVTGNLDSKYQGEGGTVIDIDTAGTEITDRIGQWAAFGHGTGAVFFAFIESATELTNAYRGFFFDSAEAIIEREILTDSDTLTLLNLVWLFVDDTPSINVVYNSPIWSVTEPASPVINDYWFDLNTNLWKSFGGAVWAVVDRIPVGLAVMDDTNCIAARAFDISKTSYNDDNSLEVGTPSSATTSTTNSSKSNIISAYGNLLDYGYSQVVWDITTDLEDGLIEANSTLYYLYISQLGEVKMSDKRPLFREDLGGYYHPWNTWRCVSSAYNDSSGDLISNGSSDIRALTGLNKTEPSMVRIMEQVVTSAVASVEFTEGITDEYAYFVLVGTGFKGAISADFLGVQLSSDGGSNYLTTGYSSFNKITGSIAGFLADRLAITDTVTWSAANAGYFEMNLYDLATDEVTKSQVESNRGANTANGYFSLGSYHTTASAMNALKLFFSFDIAAGTVTLYGVKR